MLNDNLFRNWRDEQMRVARAIKRMPKGVVSFYRANAPARAFERATKATAQPNFG